MNDTHTTLATAILSRSYGVKGKRIAGEHKSASNRTLRVALATLNGSVCHWCRTPVDPMASSAHADRILTGKQRGDCVGNKQCTTPRPGQGPDAIRCRCRYEPGNVVLACGDCNEQSEMRRRMSYGDLLAVLPTVPDAATLIAVMPTRRSV